ncbi:hypothetical protein ASE37_23375 [Rhizobium sp. Root268]|nr:hypothetical protein ASC86_22330 [Rhizobium sp. Root1212]KRD31689.1 hypothetical protein ASE37_23375 [Rhizobium sp. Root268]
MDHPQKSNRTAQKPGAPLADEYRSAGFSGQQLCFFVAWGTREKSEFRAGERRQSNEPLVWPFFLEALLEHGRRYEWIDKTIFQLIGLSIGIVHAAHLHTRFDSEVLCVLAVAIRF